MQVRADGVGIEVALEGLPRRIPTEAAAPVAHIEDNAASPRFERFRKRIARLEQAVAAALKTVRQDVARPQLIENARSIGALADVDHDGPSTGSGCFDRAFE